MAYYQFTTKAIANVLTILNQSPIKGVDASKVLEIQNAIGRADLGFVELTDELKEFLLTILNEVTFQGKYAIAIVEAQMILSKPLDEKPTPQKPAKSSKKNTVSKGPKAPK